MMMNSNHFRRGALPPGLPVGGEFARCQVETRTGVYRDLATVGRELSGVDAAAWGAIHQSVPDGELDTAVDELVGRLASGPTVALGLAKWLLHAGSGLARDQHLPNEAFALELSSRTDDFREGMTAFRERRPPKFEGR